MANWCMNTVAFEGSPEALEQIQQLFKTMAEKERKEDCGQLPDFVSDDTGGYFFAVCQNESETGIFQYETKWSPNIEAVQQIAAYYKVNSVQDYEEMGSGVYGQAVFEDNILTDTFLESADFEAYQFDEEADSYLFEGETYESEYEILETLLERKIAFEQLIEQ
ncbi:hypothetical protein [Chryseobacterium gambrini]|jgi:hypothetical protein|uniref:DUF1281 family ferredoxin-like fold protein n=1 Tax=Chryseobacterium gambrini TaxID=373672 RepID=UPI0025B4AEB6|nr:hypothetical protein [Chryseobacterium gambrini]MDN4028932.1 hypothetical protein [Chryseobacterium gambrini]